MFTAIMDPDLDADVDDEETLDEERPIKGVRRDDRRRHVAKMRVSGRMTSTLNGIRKNADAAERRQEPRDR